MRDSDPKLIGDPNCKHEYHYSKKNRYCCFHCSRRIRDRPPEYTAVEQERDKEIWFKYGRFVGQKRRWWPYDLYDPRDPKGVDRRK